MTVLIRRPIRPLIHLHDDGRFLASAPLSGIAGGDIRKTARAGEGIPFLLHVQLVTLSVRNISDREGSVIIFGHILVAVGVREVIFQLCDRQIGQIQNFLLSFRIFVMSGKERSVIVQADDDFLAAGLLFAKVAQLNDLILIAALQPREAVVPLIGSVQQIAVNCISVRIREASLSVDQHAVCRDAVCIHIFPFTVWIAPCICFPSSETDYHARHGILIRHNPVLPDRQRLITRYVADLRLCLLTLAFSDELAFLDRAVFAAVDVHRSVTMVRGVLSTLFCYIVFVGVFDIAIIAVHGLRDRQILPARNKARIGRTVLRDGFCRCTGSGTNRDRPLRVLIRAVELQVLRPGLTVRRDRRHCIRDDVIVAALDGHIAVQAQLRRGTLRNFGRSALFGRERFAELQVKIDLLVTLLVLNISDGNRRCLSGRTVLDPNTLRLDLFGKAFNGTLFDRVLIERSGFRILSLKILEQHGPRCAIHDICLFDLKAFVLLVEDLIGLCDAVLVLVGPLDADRDRINAVRRLAFLFRSAFSIRAHPDLVHLDRSDVGGVQNRDLVLIGCVPCNCCQIAVRHIAAALHDLLCHGVLNFIHSSGRSVVAEAVEIREASRPGAARQGQRIHAGNRCEFSFKIRKDRLDLPVLGIEALALDKRQNDLCARCDILRRPALLRGQLDLAAVHDRRHAVRDFAADRLKNSRTITVCPDISFALILSGEGFARA